jgi:wyosine [tRNA(Phe)-imidazoG37] synthetase (radical SAM superfamily)
MNAYELFLEELSEFKKDYSANLLERLTTIRINYLKALKVLGLESTADGGFIEIQDVLRQVENLSNLGNKIKAIKAFGSKVQREMLQASKTTKLNEAQIKVITEFQSEFNDFAYLF